MSSGAQAWATLGTCWPRRHTRRLWLGGGVPAWHRHGPREGPALGPSELMLSYLAEELSSPIFLIELWAGGRSVEALT